MMVSVREMVGAFHGGMGYLECMTFFSTKKDLRWVWKKILVFAESGLWIFGY